MHQTIILLLVRKMHNTFRVSLHERDKIREIQAQKPSGLLGITTHYFALDFSFAKLARIAFLSHVNFSQSGQG